MRGMIKPPLSVFNLPSPHPPSQALFRNGDVRTVTSTFQLLSTARAKVAVTSRCEFDIICEILGQPGRICGYTGNCVWARPVG